MAFLERNLEQLTLVQKQVRAAYGLFVISTKAKHGSLFVCLARGSKLGLEERSRHCGAETSSEEREDTKLGSTPTRRR